MSDPVKPERPRRGRRLRVWIGVVLAALGLVGVSTGGPAWLIAIAAVAGVVGLILLLWSVGSRPRERRPGSDPRDTWDALSQGEDPTERD